MREYKTFAFKRGTEEGLAPDEFTCYASTFGPPVDEGGDIVQQGAFTQTLPDFLAGGLVCWQHDWRTPIGKPLEAREDGYGLWIKAHVSDTAAGRDALTLMRDDVVKKVSIGFDIEGYRMLSDDEGRAMLGDGAYDAAVRNLPWWQDSIRVLTQLKLYEYSPVSVPMNPLARITGVKREDGSLAMLEGLTMAEQYEALLLAERDYLTRLKGLAGLRAKEGRVLSEGNRSKLQTMRESLQTHITTLDDLLVSSERVSEGVDGMDDGKTHPLATDPALALAARAQFIRFQQMEAHLHGAL